MDVTGQAQKKSAISLSHRPREMNQLTEYIQQTRTDYKNSDEVNRALLLNKARLPMF